MPTSNIIILSVTALLAAYLGFRLWRRARTRRPFPAGTIQWDGFSTTSAALSVVAGYATAGLLLGHLDVTSAGVNWALVMYIVFLALFFFVYLTDKGEQTSANEALAVKRVITKHAIAAIPILAAIGLATALTFAWETALWGETLARRHQRLVDEARIEFAKAIQNQDFLKPPSPELQASQKKARKLTALRSSENPYYVLEAIIHLGVTISLSTFCIKRLLKAYGSLGQAPAKEELDAKNYRGPRCVSCLAPIQPTVEICPTCGWPQSGV